MADPHRMKMNSHPTISRLTNLDARIAARFARHSHHASRAAACFTLYSRSPAQADGRIAPLVVDCGALLSLPTVLNVSSAPHCWRVLVLCLLVVACGSLSCVPTAAFDKLSVFSCSQDCCSTDPLLARAAPPSTSWPQAQILQRKRL